MLTVETPGDVTSERLEEAATIEGSPELPATE